MLRMFIALFRAILQIGFVYEIVFSIIAFLTCLPQLRQGRIYFLGLHFAMLLDITLEKGNNTSVWFCIVAFNILP